MTNFFSFSVRVFLVAISFSFSVTSFAEKKHLGENSERKEENRQTLVCRGNARAVWTGSETSWQFTLVAKEKTKSTQEFGSLEECQGAFKPQGDLAPRTLQEIQKRPELPPVLATMIVEKTGDATQPFDRKLTRIKLDCSGTIYRGSSSGVPPSVQVVQGKDGTSCEKKAGSKPDSFWKEDMKTVQLGAFKNEADCRWALENKLCDPEKKPKYDGPDSIMADPNADMNDPEVKKILEDAFKKLKDQN